MNQDKNTVRSYLQYADFLYIELKSNPTGDPILKHRVHWRLGEASIVRSTSSSVCPLLLSCALLLLLLFPLPPRLLSPLPVLPVVDDERKRHGQRHYDQCVYEPVVLRARIVWRVASRHGVVVDVVVHDVVVEEALILNEVIDPFAEGPVLAIFCSPLR